MPWKQNEDQKLRDVRAALRSLQRIEPDTSPQIDVQHLKPDASKSPAQSRRLGALALATIAMGTVIVLAIDLFLKYWPASPPSKQAAEISLTPSPSAAGNAAPGLPAAAIPMKTDQPVKLQTAPASGTAPPANAALDPRIIQVLDNARQLMDAGHIVQARKMLSQPALAASQDAAWLTARSFDPNYLATVQSADATADKGQAEEWYRRWRDIGARNGVAMDDTRLKRLIDAMQ